MGICEFIVSLIFMLIIFAIYVIISYLLYEHFEKRKYTDTGTKEIAENIFYKYITDLTVEDGKCPTNMEKYSIPIDTTGGTFDSELSNKVICVKYGETYKDALTNLKDQCQTENINILDTYENQLCSTLEIVNYLNISKERSNSSNCKNYTLIDEYKLYVCKGTEKGDIVVDMIAKPNQIYSDYYNLLNKEAVGTNNKYYIYYRNYYGFNKNIISDNKFPNEDIISKNEDNLKKSKDFAKIAFILLVIDFLWGLINIACNICLCVLSKIPCCCTCSLCCCCGFCFLKILSLFFVIGSFVCSLISNKKLRDYNLDYRDYMNESDKALVELEYSKIDDAKKRFIYIFILFGIWLIIGIIESLITRCLRKKTVEKKETEVKTA